MVATLDDLTLIEQFVSGDIALAANQNLRIETTFKTTQLLGKRGMLLAKIERGSEIPSALVRPESEYHELIRAALLKSQFTPAYPSMDERGFLIYERCQIPEGYKVNYAEARQLWKYWYLQRRDRGQINLDLLILVRKSWYPIRDVSHGQEMFIISTLTDEIVVNNTCPIVWLSRHVESAAEEPSAMSPTTVNPIAQPIRRHFNAYRERMNEHDAAGEAVWRGQLVANPEQSELSSESQAVSDSSLPGHSPHREEVFQLRDGKLYVKTAVGELVVEGNNLRFWLNSTSADSATET